MSVPGQRAGRGRAGGAGEVSERSPIDGTPPRPAKSAGGAVERQRDGAGRRPSTAHSAARRAEPGPAIHGRRQPRARERVPIGIGGGAEARRQLEPGHAVNLAGAGGGYPARSRGRGNGGCGASMLATRAGGGQSVERARPRLLSRAYSGQASEVTCYKRRFSLRVPVCETRVRENQDDTSGPAAIQR